MVVGGLTHTEALLVPSEMDLLWWSSPVVQLSVADVQ